MVLLKMETFQSSIHKLVHVHVTSIRQYNRFLIKGNSYMHMAYFRYSKELKQQC